MKTCPVCTTALVEAQRQGIEIDHCPRCRGVWLDRGELGKIIERSAQSTGYAPDDDDSDWGEDRGRHGGHSRGDYPPQSQPPPRKKEGFFSRLFDFD
jgi:Zn-finger nucleic acid-binding protein